MFAGALELAVRVGAGGHRTGAPSTVRMADSTIVARGGQSKSNGAGGDGYCGGGGVGGRDGNGWYYGGIGGTNGGKGGQGTITYPRHPHHYQGVPGLSLCSNCEVMVKADCRSMSLTMTGVLDTDCNHYSDMCCRGQWR